MPENPYKSVSGPQNIPDNLKVPDGNVLLLQAFGKGVQKYVCAATATTSKFSPPVPHAILLKDDRDEGDLVAIHFGGPTWEALDGSSVVGDTTAGALQSAPAPDPDGVPWLLLTAKSHGGNGLFSRVTYIQRLFTDGGQPPTSGCDQAHDKAEVLVEYSAQYFFYGPATEQQ
jgi:Protein of unknown function (DUF3455)